MEIGGDHGQAALEDFDSRSRLPVQLLLLLPWLLPVCATCRTAGGACPEACSPADSSSAGEPDCAADSALRVANRDVLGMEELVRFVERNGSVAAWGKVLGHFPPRLGGLRSSAYVLAGARGAVADIERIQS